MKVYKLTMHGSTIWNSSFKGLFEMIEAEDIESFEGDGIDLNISTAEMTEEEYNNLPEFDGF